MSTCKICHKPLTEALSVKLGIGPVCRMNRKMAQSGDDLFNREERSCYDYSIVDGVVCIFDNDRGRSVTTDAAHVVADLIADGIDLATHPVIYRDTDGVWDRIVVENGRMAGFAPLTAVNRGEAIEKLRAATKSVSAVEKLWQEARAGRGDFTHIDYQTGKVTRHDNIGGVVDSFIAALR